ncbi:GntR family transcriptional regulator [Brenneria alni]|uniref:GntR family transcriptional regulator n=1 Tax=Brenneria alni TaxID=71656 RepID=UPI003B8377E6
MLLVLPINGCGRGLKNELGGVRLYQQIGGNIHAEILNGKYQIGDRPSPERDIVEAFGASRSAVREALIRR